MRPLDSSPIIPISDSGSIAEENPRLPQPSQLLLLLSFGLVGAGLVVLAGVLVTVYETFNDPMSNRLVTDFSKELATHPLILSSDASSFRIGEGAATLLAMLLFTLFAGIAAAIGSTLVRAGVQAVFPPVHSQFEALRKRLEVLVQRFRR